MTPKETAKKAVAVVEQDMGLADMKERATLLVKSGLLPKAIDTPEKALVVMMMGQEYGISPMKAFQSIHIIEGRTALSSQLMLALCERTGEVEDCKIEPSDTFCRVTLKRKGRSAVTVTFGDTDAKSMKTKAWIGGVAKVISLSEKYNYVTMKRDMYVARAISRAARYAFPDAVLGLYVQEEAYDVIDAGVEQKIEAAAVVTETAEEKAAELMAPVDAAAGTIHAEGEKINLVDKLSLSYIQDPTWAGYYSEKTLGEILGDKTPGGKPKGKEFLRTVAEKSKNADDRANITTFLDLLEKEVAK